MVLLVSEETDRHNCTNLGDWEEGERERGKKGSQEESTEETKKEETFKKQRSMEKNEERQTNRERERERERETLENELKNCSYTNISTRAHAHTHIYVCVYIYMYKVLTKPSHTISILFSKGLPVSAYIMAIIGSCLSIRRRKFYPLLRDGSHPCVYSTCFLLKEFQIHVSVWTVAILAKFILVFSVLEHADVGSRAFLKLCAKNYQNKKGHVSGNCNL